eukprot:3368334-Amphidinium_carterae.1
MAKYESYFPLLSQAKRKQNKASEKGLCTSRAAFEQFCSLTFHSLIYAMGTKCSNGAMAIWKVQHRVSALFIFGGVGSLLWGRADHECYAIRGEKRN